MMSSLTPATAPHPKLRLRVVFMLFYTEAWDAFEAVYRRMLTDERFEPIVVAIPRRLTGYESWGDLDRVSGFLTKADVPHLSFDYEDSFEGLEKLKQLSPDYIFLNYPWMRNYQPGYRIENLLWSRVCYIPYFSLPLVYEPSEQGVALHLYTQPAHQESRLIFTADTLVTAALSQSDRSGRGRKGVVFSGSPKLDGLVARAQQFTRETAPWPLAGTDRLRLVWAPHHSYHEGWLNFGNFVEVHEKMLRFASKHPEFDFVLRPHPFLFSTMTGRELLKRKHLKRWRKAWNALPNTAIDLKSDPAELFAATDLLFTDGISFIAEYPLATGRPAIFLERAGHWQFTELGELSASASVTISRFKEFKELIKGLSETDAQLPNRDAEIAKLRAAALPNPGRTAEIVTEAVWQDFWG